jgi:uncharacterized protein (UPF0276 family)
VTKKRAVGLGLRWEFIDALIQRAPSEIDFLEISPENYMRRGGYFPAALSYLRSRYPVITHGLTMSLGGVDPLDDAYLAELRAFIQEMKSPWHSDHLCFGSVDGAMLHDLLPLSFNEATVRRVADRVRRAQDALGVPMAVENISFYMHPGKREMSEPEFITRVCEAADCKLMLDVNNAYVNSINFGFDAREWMKNVPLDRVVQIHVAGHEWFDEGDFGGKSGSRVILDTHGASMIDPMLALLEGVLKVTGPVPILLERDQSIPSLDDLLVELARVRAVVDSACPSAEEHAALAEVGE